MHWFVAALRENPELALFLSLALGQALGRLRFGSFALGPVLGTLVAGLVVGQLGIGVAASMQAVFFLLFLFAIGFRTGPEFFQGLRSSAGPQIVLTILLCGTGLAATWVLARLSGFNGGTAAGLLAGALTSSTALGTATGATASFEPGLAATLAHDVATAYAITYFLGTFLVVWFLPAIGPRLMRVKLHDACAALEQEMGVKIVDPAVASAYQEFTARAYRVPPPSVGRTVADLEALWPEGRRLVVFRVRREGTLLDAEPAMRLRAGDVIAVSGAPQTLLGESSPLRDEVHDRELLDVPTVSADLVLTNRRLAGRSLATVVQEIGARQVFLLKLRRGGRELPVTRGTVVLRGDVMTVTGSQLEVKRVAHELGFAEYPPSATDLLLVAATIVAGGLIGLPTIALGRIEIGLSAPVGVLIAGLFLGHLRSVNPRFGRIPEASVWLFESLGLTAFLALVGLAAGPGLIAGLRASGVILVAAGVLVALLPHVVTILVGRHALQMHPGILLGVCAGAGTSAPALAELEKAARSKIPALGYGMACAVGNVLLAVSGTVLVLLIGS